MKKNLFVLIISLFFIQGTFADYNNNYYVRCGENSYLSSKGKCICYSGYVREDFEDGANLNCIKQSDYEIIYCGKNSYVNSNGKCVCLSGYKWENYYDENNLDCIKKDDFIYSSCGINEYYVYDYSTREGKCQCKIGYDKSPGSDLCTAHSKYNLTNDDLELLEQFSEILYQLSETNINKLISLRLDLEELLPSLNKNGRNFYLLNEIYILIDSILVDNDLVGEGN